jgi:hypothetical protein
MELSCAIRFTVCLSSNYDFITEGGIGMESDSKKGASGWLSRCRTRMRGDGLVPWGEGVPRELSPHFIDSQLGSTKVSRTERAALENMLLKLASSTCSPCSKHIERRCYVGPCRLSEFPCLCQDLTPKACVDIWSTGSNVGFIWYYQTFCHRQHCFLVMKLMVVCSLRGRLDNSHRFIAS